MAHFAGTATHALLAKSFLTPTLEGPVGDPQFFGRRPAGEFAPAPCGHGGRVVLTPVLEFPPKVDALGLGGGDPFGLPLTVELPLRLGHIAQKLGQSAPR